MAVYAALFHYYFGCVRQFMENANGMQMLALYLFLAMISGCFTSFYIFFFLFFFPPLNLGLEGCNFRFELS